MSIKKYILLPFAVLAVSAVSAQHQVVIKVNEPKAKIQPGMWGVFFEDINFGADGGLYAEMIKNRSFEFTRPLMGWKIEGKPVTEGDFQVINRVGENGNNPRYLRVTLHKAAKGSLGISNEGFRGIGIKKGLRYDFSVQYRQPASSSKLWIELVNAKGVAVGGTEINTTFTGTEWKKATASFTAADTAVMGRFNIWFEGEGIIDLDLVSLFPSDTWKGRPGGLRADMVQWLADMKPGFVRFPGGCIVEGFQLSQRYQWKKTVGPADDRQLIMNRWNNEFAHRAAPDYFQSFGLGFFEYFQLAEDIGARPLPILNCGMACQFNSAELVSLDDLQPYIQDALDLVEFANGDEHAGWGKLRAEMGHPAPFHLTMMGVGNENWGPQYVERLKRFTDAIKSRYPDIQIVNSSGTDPNGARFDYLNNELRLMKADIIDEHYYRPPEWFFANASRYDNYPRNASKVFCGEYAAHSDKVAQGESKNCWLAALSEAAFMTGLERNADVVYMASYAPLFSNADAWQWSPDLIWVNNLQSYGTPNYYVQQLYSLNQGTVTVPITMDGKTMAGQDSLYASASVNENTHELIIKLVNAGGAAQSQSISLEGLKKAPVTASRIVLEHASLWAVNSFGQPQNIVPKQEVVTMKGKTISLVSEPYSFNVVRVKLSS